MWSAFELLYAVKGVSLIHEHLSNEDTVWCPNHIELCVYKYKSELGTPLHIQNRQPGPVASTIERFHCSWDGLARLD